LPDYVIFAVLLLRIPTIGGILRLRPYRAVGYLVLAALWRKKEVVS
jgi:hypothetical protein